MNGFFSDIIEPKQHAAKATKHTAIRKVRSDKEFDIKFPVSTHVMKALKARADLYREPKMKPTQTLYNSRLIQALLQNSQYASGEISSVPYSYTGSYFHVKLTKHYIEQVNTLAVGWGVSKRKAVHRLIETAVRRGDLI